MYAAALWTLILIPGVNAPETNTTTLAPVPTNATVTMGNTMVMGDVGTGCSSCGESRSRRCGHGSRHGRRQNGSWWGAMPQTCYNPHYGCYPGASRTMHRHSAFHGNFYRRPYNYRNYFDYPWHTRIHEPTSRFSYNVPRNQETNAPTPAAPAPMPIMGRR